MPHSVERPRRPSRRRLRFVVLRPGLEDGVRFRRVRPRSRTSRAPDRSNGPCGGPPVKGMRVRGDEGATADLMTRPSTWTALGEWTVLGSFAGMMCGASSALFLWLLEWVTTFRVGHPVIVYALPVAGLLVGAIYERFGKSIAGGNDLVIDTLHDEGPQIPLRMAPMVLIGTALTHLFGGSAGREGTAVQMGASLSDWMSHRLGVRKPVRRQLLAAGIAGGFGSVFGTPVAGAVFGLELVVLGRLEYQALVPALVASLVGDMVTRALGIAHVAYPAAPPTSLTPLLLGKWLVFAAACALVAIAFIELTHFLRVRGQKLFARLPIRMFVGGLIVVALWKLVGTSDYLGLGIPVILGAFRDPQLPVYVFALKLLFTAVTLGAGFLGGEVTPLFLIGAALGSVLARWLGIPIELGAGVGLAAVFAAASNTPVALSIMAVELMGAHVLPHVAIVCVVAYVLSGHRSIYRAQRLLRAKSGLEVEPPIALRDLSAVLLGRPSVESVTHPAKPTAELQVASEDVEPKPSPSTEEPDRPAT